MHSAPNLKPISLKEWVRRISEEEMPVFAHTARQIASASKGIDTPVAELAELILQDSSMTARVLRLANSAYYNPAGQPINTISRAIILLGFDVVRSIALTIAIIDPLLKGLQHEYVVQEMARCFHAAVQAKSFAHTRGINDVEEVFIAALLYRLGHMAFWCFPFGHAKTLDLAYKEWDEPEQAEQHTLGFALKHLTAALNSEWHLSELLTLLLEPDQQGSATQDLNHAYQLVLAVEEGWGSLKAKKAIDAIAKHITLSREETLALVQKNAFEAVQTAKEFGIEIAGKHIPLPENLDLATLDAAGGNPRAQEPDYQLQLDILRELTAMLHEKVNINALLSSIMEGVYRALAMERTVIAFVGPDNHLKAKYLLGDDKGKNKRCFDFVISDNGQDFFSYVLAQKQAVWLNSKTRKQLEPLLTNDIRQCLGILDFFVMPIWIGGKGKGVIYADCKYSGRTLKQSEFQSFAHFCEYASIGFELFTRQK